MKNLQRLVPEQLVCVCVAPSALTDLQVGQAGPLAVLNPAATFRLANKFQPPHTNQCALKGEKAANKP